MGDKAQKKQDDHEIAAAKMAVQTAEEIRNKKRESIMSGVSNNNAQQTAQEKRHAAFREKRNNWARQLQDVYNQIYDSFVITMEEIRDVQKNQLKVDYFAGNVESQIKQLKLNLRKKIRKQMKDIMEIAKEIGSKDDTFAQLQENAQIADFYKQGILEIHELLALLLNMQVNRNRLENKQIKKQNAFSNVSVQTLTEEIKRSTLRFHRIKAGNKLSKVIFDNSVGKDQGNNLGTLGAFEEAEDKKEYQNNQQNILNIDTFDVQNTLKDFEKKKYSLHSMIDGFIQGIGKPGFTFDQKYKQLDDYFAKRYELRGLYLGERKLSDFMKQTQQRAEEMQIVLEKNKEENNEGMDFVAQLYKEMEEVNFNVEDKNEEAMKRVIEINKDIRSYLIQQEHEKQMSDLKFIEVEQNQQHWDAQFGQEDHHHNSNRNHPHPHPHLQQKSKSFKVKQDANKFNPLEEKRQSSSNIQGQLNLDLPKSHLASQRSFLPMSKLIPKASELITDRQTEIYTDRKTDATSRVNGQLTDRATQNNFEIYDGKISRGQIRSSSSQQLDYQNFNIVNIPSQSQSKNVSPSKNKKYRLGKGYIQRIVSLEEHPSNPNLHLPLKYQNFVPAESLKFVPIKTESIQMFSSLLQQERDAYQKKQRIENYSKENVKVKNDFLAAFQANPMLSSTLSPTFFSSKTTLSQIPDQIRSISPKTCRKLTSEEELRLIDFETRGEQPIYLSRFNSVVRNRRSKQRSSQSQHDSSKTIQASQRKIGTGMVENATTSPMASDYLISPQVSKISVVSNPIIHQKITTQDTRQTSPFDDEREIKPKPNKKSFPSETSLLFRKSQSDLLFKVNGSVWRNK